MSPHEAEHLAKSNAELQQQAKLLRTTLLSIGDGVLTADSEGKVTFLNPVAEELTGWLNSDAVGRPVDEVFNIINEQTRDPVESPVSHVLREGVIIGLANHTILISRDGTDIPIDDSGAPILDSYGKVHGAVLVFRDVTERRRAELERQRLAAIVESSEDAIVSKDLNGIVMSWNKAAERIYGYKAEEIIGKSKALVIPADIPDELPTILRKMAEKERIQHYQTDRIRKDGTRINVSISVSPLLDSEGEVIGASTIARDITERKQEDATRHFLTQASEVLASSLDYEATLNKVTKLAVPHIADWCAVDMLKSDGTVHLVALAHSDPDRLQWGHELREKYPQQPEERGLPSVLASGKSELHSEISDAQLANAAKDAEHLSILRKIGFRSVMIVPILAREEVLGAITFVRTTESGHTYNKDDLVLAEGLAARAGLAIDNSRLYRAAQEELAERTRADAALRESEERFRFALAGSDIAVYMQDLELRYTWIYNGQTQGERTELYGSRDRDFLEAQDAERLTEIKQRVLQTGIEERHTVRATRFGKEPAYFDTLFAPMRDDQDNITGLTGTVRDVTERKKIADKMASQQEEVADLNKRLQRAMSETHHRVKNNLQIISALLNMETMRHEQSIPTENIQQVSQHVRALALIHDLLTRQATEDSLVEDLSVKVALEQLLPTIQGLIESRALRYTIDDAKLSIRQATSLAVLVNELISNAIKHATGDITLRFTVTDETAKLEVEDEGAGFPDGFDPVTAGNTGLEIAESLTKWDLGGKIEYENRPEGGARIVVEFPIKSAAKACL